jgi:glycosyltransferase involved in cell wall biosynthesis
MTPPSVSVLVNTWNRADFLRNCLQGYLRQTVRNFEIVVADDGSEDHTPEVVETFRRSSGIPIDYVRHERDGHRRTVILNKGIVACRAPLILFTDCDCVPQGDLVEQHLQSYQANRLLCGGFIPLTAEETARVTPELILEGRHEEFLNPSRRRSLKWRQRKDSFYVLIRRPRRPHNYGMNFSVSKEDLLAINGFDESFRGVGGADGDVRRRLGLLGVRPMSIFATAVVFHQFHPPDPTKTSEVKARNQALARRPDVPMFCIQGIQKPPAATQPD